jgi:uncharacterized protein DUF1344
MRKAFGLAIVLTLALAMPVLAEQTQGTINSINPADHSFTLADGTRLWVDDTQIADLAVGDNVQAMYQAQGDKKVVTDLYRNAIGPDGRGITYYGTGYNNGMIDPIQAGD